VIATPSGLLIDRSGAAGAACANLTRNDILFSPFLNISFYFII
jgi:hypothetical protein